MKSTTDENIVPFYTVKYHRKWLLVHFLYREVRNPYSATVDKIRPYHFTMILIPVLVR